MRIFELILALLLGASILAIVARRSGVPYPALLVLMGVGVSLLPGLPALDLDPDLILALFVAPVLLDAAHDMSFRDLRRNWRPVLSLVVVAVGLTTVAIAVTSRWFLPDLPWGAAIALGALLAPPDAVAALSVMRHVDPPHRIRTVLEGESLLNDASSLIIYRLAVGAVATGGFSLREAMPMLLLVSFGSVVAGWFLAKMIAGLLRRVEDAATATVLQFVTTFGVWLLAEQSHLSPVITVVSFGLTAARAPTSAMLATVRVSSFSTWETVTFVLNILAFVLVGMQLRSILPSVAGGQAAKWLGIAFLCLVVATAVRFAWVFLYRQFSRDDPNRPDAMSRDESFKAAIVVAWSGMRGIVTLAAALALPATFPYRDFILLTAFVVVLGTLLLQGLTLRPLLLWLKMPRDTVVKEEIVLARQEALGAALLSLRDVQGLAAERLRQEYKAELAAKSLGESSDLPGSVLRRSAVRHARLAVDALRDQERIGDEAYRRVERELDLMDLNNRG